MNVDADIILKTLGLERYQHQKAIEELAEAQRRIAELESENAKLKLLVAQLPGGLA